jgi:hypothetical protein
MPVKPRPPRHGSCRSLQCRLRLGSAVVETMRLGPQRKRTMAEIDDDPRVAPSEDEQGSNVAPTEFRRRQSRRPNLTPAGSRRRPAVDATCTAGWANS